jgi:hypothetical protein
MSWQYQQASGWLLGPLGNVSQGYSGAKPDGVNNPMMESVVDVGPIPKGQYEIEGPIDTDAHGPYALPLIPAEGNEMFGRSGFLIHGDSIEASGSASEGCVIMPRTAREAIWESGDHTLIVV